MAPSSSSSELAPPPGTSFHSLLNCTGCGASNKKHDTSRPCSVSRHTADSTARSPPRGVPSDRDNSVRLRRRDARRVRPRRFRPRRGRGVSLQGHHRMVSQRKRVDEFHVRQGTVPRTRGAPRNNAGGRFARRLQRFDHPVVGDGEVARDGGGGGRRSRTPRGNFIRNFIRRRRRRRQPPRRRSSPSRRSRPSSATSPPPKRPTAPPPRIAPSSRTPPRR